MPTTTLYPSTITTVKAWTNPDNAKADDGIYAVTAGTRNTNHEITGSGFDLSGIPSGSTINSVALEAQYKLSTTASAWTGTLAAVKNGVLDNGTAITTTAEPTVDTVWQNTGTGSYTLDTLAQLGVFFSVRRSSYTGCNYSVDYLALVIDYTAPSYNYSGTVTESSGDASTLSASKATSSSLTDSNGAQSTLTGVKYIQTFDFTGTVSESIGDQSSLNGMKSTSTTLPESIGEQSSTTALKSATSNLSDSIGEVSSQSGYKAASSALSDSLGNQITYSYTTGIPMLDYTGTASESIGNGSYLTGAKNIGGLCYDSIGEQIALTAFKQIGQALSELIGEQSLLSGTKAISAEIFESIGDQCTYSYTTGELTYEYTGTATESIGESCSVSGIANKQSALSATLGETLTTTGTKQGCASIVESIGSVFIIDGNALKQCLIYNPVSASVAYKITDKSTVSFNTADRSSVRASGSNIGATKFNPTESRGVKFDPTDTKEVQLDY